MEVPLIGGYLFITTPTPSKGFTNRLDYLPLPLSRGGACSGQDMALRGVLGRLQRAFLLSLFTEMNSVKKQGLIISYHGDRDYPLGLLIPPLAETNTWISSHWNSRDVSGFGHQSDIGSQTLTICDSALESATPTRIPRWSLNQGTDFRQMLRVWANKDWWIEFLFPLLLD